MYKPRATDSSASCAVLCGVHGSVPDVRTGATGPNSGFDPPSSSWTPLSCGHWQVVPLRNFRSLCKYSCFNICPQVRATNDTVSVTTIPTLLALHIESALDPTETQLIRSMSLISINQAMLVLAEGRDIPVLRRALPIFEKILAKNNLYLIPSTGQPNRKWRCEASTCRPGAELGDFPSKYPFKYDRLILYLGQGPVHPPSRDTTISDASASLHTLVHDGSPQPEQWPDNLLDMNFLELDFLGEWQHNGQLEPFD